MTSKTVRRVAALFTMLFAIIALRQAYVQVIARPHLAANPYNPRHALLSEHRGRILASDGSVLAETVGGARRYPFGAALAQTVGYVSARYGTSGLEDTFDPALTPPDTTGEPFAQLGSILEAIGGQNSVARGADVVTTIDPAIENALYGELAQHARGAGVVLNPQTGAVLALASMPSFDPNDLAAEFPQLLHAANSPLINRATDGLYPPGSTFKVFTASAALDSGVVTPASTFYDPGYYQIGNYVLHDNEGEATGEQNLTGAFALSSNVDFGHIALEMGAPTFYQYLGRWGIGSSLDFQLPAAHASVPAQNTILPGELAQMAFGQGALLVSPLQMALITATVANGGVEPRPFLVRQVVRQGGATNSFGPAELNSPIAADTAAKVKNMMIAVVQRGTGTPAQLANVTVAGKTGTATNPFGAPHSWFVAFAPAENPRVAVAIVVENAGYGAAVAAPIARNILRLALARTRLPQ